MKRDLDLIRQILIDIENQGTDCSPSVLRTSAVDDTNDRIRYHVRQLLDGGYLKEIDRTVNGAPCVRLTHAGHELIELAQSESRWQEAKWFVREQTGGESLSVLKAVLTKWAAEAATHGDVWRSRSSYRPSLHRVEAHRVEPRYRTRTVESRTLEPRPLEPRTIDSRYYESRPIRVERPTVRDEELRLVRTRPDYLERFDWRNTDWRTPVNLDRYDRSQYAYESLYADRYYTDSEYLRERTANGEVGVSLPIHVV